MGRPFQQFLSGRGKHVAIQRSQILRGHALLQVKKLKSAEILCLFSRITVRRVFAPVPRLKAEKEAYADPGTGGFMKIKYFFLLFVTTLAFGQVEEYIRVLQRDLRVHVVDKKGDPIRGLTAADFLVFENDKEQGINFFQEVDFMRSDESRDSPAAQTTEVLEDVKPGQFDPQKSRTCVIVFDSSSMSKGAFENSRKALRELIGKLNNNDLVKIVQMDLHMTDITPFTRDRQELLLGLETLEYQGTQYREIVRQQRRIVRSIEDFLKVQAGGVAGDQLQESAALEVNREVDAKARIKGAYYKTFYYNMMYMGKMLTHMSGSKSVFLLSGGSYIDASEKAGNTTGLGERLNSILNKANATIYSFLYKGTSSIADSSFDMMASSTDFRMQDLRNTGNFAQEAGFNTLRGTLDTGDSLNTIVENQIHAQTGLEHASKGTGGLLVRTTTKKFAGERLDKILDASSHYYRLGYTIFGSEKAARVKALLTKKIPGARLLYGKDLAPPENYLDLDEKEQRLTLRVLMNFNDVNRNDLSADWKHYLYYRDDIGYTIPVFGRAPQLDKPQAGYEVAFAAFDQYNEPMDMVISRVKSPVEGKSFDFYDVLVTAEPPKAIKCYLRNMDTGELTLQKMDLGISEAEVRRTRISDMVFGSETSPEPLPLNHTRKTVVDSEGVANEEELDNRVVGDPYWINKQLFACEFEAEFKRPKKLDLMFHVENITQSKEPLNVRFALWSKEKGIFPARGGITAAEQVGGSMRYVIRILTDDLTPGEYAVMVRVSRADQQGELQKAQAFAVK